jgi:hypothetical protein
MGDDVAGAIERVEYGSDSAAAVDGKEGTVELVAAISSSGTDGAGV